MREKSESRSTGASIPSNTTTTPRFEESDSCSNAIAPVVSDTSATEKSIAIRSVVKWDTENVKLALTKTVPLELRDSGGSTPFLWAVQNGEIEIVRQLVELGANINGTDRGDRSAFHLVAWNGDAAMSYFLAEIGASMRLKDVNGATPLHHATIADHLNILQCLLRDDIPAEYRVDIEAENNAGLTALHQAAMGGNAGIVGFLLDHGASTTRTTPNDGNALWFAVDLGHTDILRELIARGEDIHQLFASGYNALYWAASKGHLDITRLLLDQEGAEVDARCIYNDCTPLVWATFNGHSAISQLLIDRGADIEAMDCDGYRILHILAKHGREDSARLMLENGAHIDGLDARLASPLLYAALEGHVGVVRLLLDFGADFTTLDEKGKSALHHAVENGREEVGRMLIEDGADIETKDSEGFTSLHHAAFQGKDNCVSLLLSHGADTSVKENCDKTPLELAAQKGHTAVMTLLILGVPS
jgi:ankyrin repeat protein